MKYEIDSLSNLLLHIEISSDKWVKMNWKEKIRYLATEMFKLKSGKCIDVGCELVGAVTDIVRSNISSRVVRDYLGLIDTTLGLTKATAVLNNMFISSTHRIHTEHDAIARFLGVEGGGVKMTCSDMDATVGMCEAFLKLTPAQQKTYGLVFNRVKVRDDSDNAAEEADGIAPRPEVDGSIITTYLDCTYHSPVTEEDLRMGFEVVYSKGVKGKESEADSWSYINFAVPFTEPTGDYRWIEDIPDLIARIFIDSIDVSANLIELKGTGISTRPRVNIDFDVKNFDLTENGTVIRTMDSETRLIKRVLENRGRRGYIVQGDQGTGKTISVNRLLMNFPDVPVFWISPDAISDNERMERVFNILGKFPGSFFIFDDFDGNDFEKKGKMTSQFISSIDETTSPKYRGITILIINEPQKLHSTIKLRPGRIDDIIFVRNPESVEQVTDIVTQRFKHMKLPLPDWVSAENEEFRQAAESIVENSLTHAYIAGIVNDLVTINPEGYGCEQFRQLIERKRASIRYARMVAGADGHIVDPEKAESRASETR